MCACVCEQRFDHRNDFETNGKQVKYSLWLSSFLSFWFVQVDNWNRSDMGVISFSISSINYILVNFKKTVCYFFSYYYCRFSSNDGTIEHIRSCFRHGLLIIATYYKSKKEWSAQKIVDCSKIDMRQSRVSKHLKLNYKS